MTRVIAGSLLSVILVSSSFVAVNRGLSSLFASPGNSRLAIWREGKHQPQQHDWEKVRGSLEKAMSYDSRNPDLLHALGAVYEAEFVYLIPGDTAARKNRDIARQYYLRALSGRPSWPHDWIDLALVKYRLDQIDAEFYRAMRQAVVLGPWEPWVQYVVADIGMRNWYQFDNEMHKLIIGVIHDGMQHNPEEMFKLVRRYDMLEVVCNSGRGAEQVMNYCARYQHH